MNIARNMNTSNKPPPTGKNKTSVPSAGSHNNITNAMDLKDADLFVGNFFSCGLQEIWNSVKKYAEKNKFEVCQGQGTDTRNRAGGNKLNLVCSRGELSRKQKRDVLSLSSNLHDPDDDFETKLAAQKKPRKIGISPSHWRLKFKFCPTKKGSTLTIASLVLTNGCIPSQELMLISRTKRGANMARISGFLAVTLDTLFNGHAQPCIRDTIRQHCAISDDVPIKPYMLINIKLALQKCVQNWKHKRTFLWILTWTT